MYYQPHPASDEANKPRQDSGSPHSTALERILNAKRTFGRPPSSALPRPSSSSSSSSSALLYETDLIPQTETPSLKDIDESLFHIKTTPYEKSFASRLYGFGGTPGLRGDVPASQRVLLHRDWEIRTDWMELLDDIHAHHILKHDLSHDMAYQQAPIDYVALQEWHINQVHDLLRTSFWPRIDVSTALEYHPEKYTVVAMYRRVVVGVALISPPPDEAYVTYITVKEGWKNAGIAKTMLYLLIRSSPDRDIMLHVSADNPAMILYNKFGFKAEEFVVGFYEDYIDPKSKACRNALRLRLRQQ